jgi:hypothetical protein
MPTTVLGSNHRLVASGTASSEGLISRSADGKFVVLSGYDSAIPAGSSLTGSASATTPRVVGRLDASGNIDTTTALTDWSTGNNPRSATSSDGVNFWVAGAAGGVRYTTLGATTSVQVNPGSVVNFRQVNIFAGQLYASDSSMSLRLSAVGTGLPTTLASTITNIPGFSTSSGSPYAFFFADLDGNGVVETLYVTDDTSGTTPPAGLTKYSLVSGSWVANGTVGTGNDAYRGVTGVVSGNNVVLFAVRGGGTGATGGGQLVSLVDANALTSTFAGTPTVLATAGNQVAFRGVALAPTP